MGRNPDDDPESLLGKEALIDYSQAAVGKYVKGCSDVNSGSQLPGRPICGRRCAAPIKEVQLGFLAEKSWK